MRRIVIVGASVAGVQAAQSLRSAGFEGQLTLLEAEEEIPYNRPPLSKELLSGELEEEDIGLISRETASNLALDLRLGCPAIALDLRARSVKTEYGDVGFDELIIATGGSAASPASWGRMPGVHVLRTLSDARTLKKAFSSGGPKLVVVGGGFIGCEIASTARQMGLHTTIVEARATLMSRSLDPWAAKPIEASHLAAGVTLCLGPGVDALHGTDRVEQVELGSGERIAADLVVVGIGSHPETRWLKGSGLSLDRGVRTDKFLSAGPGVHAIGDVARWHDLRTGLDQRVEHWTNARNQARLVAHNLLHPDARKPFIEIPYVWSHQYGRRIQIMGDVRGSQVKFIAEPSDDGYLALVGDGTVVTGAVGYGEERLFRRARQSVARGSAWNESTELVS